MDPLINDHDYMNMLYDNRADEKWTKIWEDVFPKLMDDYYAYAAENNIFTDDGLKEVKELKNEYSSPKKSFQGRYIKELVQFVDGFILKSDQVSRFNVGLLPMHEINACTIKTPQDSKVILINSAIIIIFVNLSLYYHCYDSWMMNAPYCKDYTKDEFGIGIISLAKFCANGDYLDFMGSAKLSCKSVPRVSMTNVPGLITQFMQSAVILHELGHIQLGHLNNDKIKVKSLGRNRNPVDIYTFPNEEEFDADNYAFMKLASILPKSSAAFHLGLIFRFFDLVEYLIGTQSYSHPAAINRWHNIKNIAKLNNDKNTPITRLDQMFDEFKKQLQYESEITLIQNSFKKLFEK